MIDDQKPPFRADQVGSLLRPEKLLAMREKYAAGEVSADELRAVEDECIREVVRLQESAGLEGITDGEFRRESFTHDFINKIRGAQFQRIPEEETGSGDKRRRPPFRAVITERMQRPEDGIELENFRFLRSTTGKTAKICLPSPTMMHFRGGRKAVSTSAYPEMEEFFHDLGRIFNEEVLGLAEMGCRYLQFDDTNLAYLCDENMREGVRELGEDPDELLYTYTKLINDSIKNRPGDMAVTIHLCRGNAFSAGFARGGYEPVADIMFNQTNVDGFFLEYDDERSGDFAPLRHVPKDKTIVLGLVSSKQPELEKKDQLKRRIDEAASYLPLEQLALSPQCGFSSSTRGANKIGEDVEKAKLELVVETARAVWG